MSTRSAEKNREYQAAYAARYLAEHGEYPSTAYRRKNGRKQDPRKECGWCGIAHPLNDAGTTLDSEGMTHAHWLRYHGKPSESREMVHVAREPTKWQSKRPARIATKRQWVFIVQGPCNRCGESFAAMATSQIKAPRYCSMECAKRASKANYALAHGEFVVDPLRRTRLHERDGWTCMICHEPTSLTYSHADPWSPTLDHIVPRSILKDDSDDALRTAHALCNSIRSDDRKTDDEVAQTVRPLIYNTFTSP